MVVVGPPREGNKGFVAESPPGGGALNREGVCVLCAPPAAGAAAPKSGLEAPSALVVGVVVSAGLLTPPKRPPPVLEAAGVADGVLPNSGFGVVDVAPAPKRLPVVCGWEVLGGVADEGAADDGVVVEPEFKPPKRLGGLDAGGGPAGVVEVLPNIGPPAGAGVADGAVLPNKPPPAGLVPPKRPLVAVCPGVVVSVVLAGV